MPRLSQPSMKTRQRQLRETAILDAARALLATRGFAAMTLDEVIAEVGISKPTFYGHFASKEDLGIRVLLRAMQDARDRIEALEATLPPDQALRTMIEWSLDKHYGPASDRDFAGALALFAHEDVQAAERDLAKRLAALVAKAQRNGSVRATAAPLFVAQTLHSILKDAAYDDLHRRGRLDLAAFKASVTTMLLGE